MTTSLMKKVLEKEISRDLGIDRQHMFLILQKCWQILRQFPEIFAIENSQHQGAVSIRKTVLPGMAIPMLKIRRPNGRLIFNMEIAIRR